MGYKFDQVKWRGFAAEIKAIREKVFVYEYRMPEISEFDNNDTDCEHVLIRNDDGQAIATGRLCSDGKISRIAVLMKYRKSNASQQVLDKLLAIAKFKGLTSVSIDSELADVHKYQEQGFVPLGGVYMEAGIAKQTLTCPLDKFRCHNSILH